MRVGEHSADAGPNSGLLEKRFARDPSMVSRRVADECILVPVRRKVDDVESIFTLNEVGARIWELIDGERRVAEVRDQIVAEFDAGREQVEADLLRVLQQLAEIGAISEVRLDDA